MQCGGLSVDVVVKESGVSMRVYFNNVLFCAGLTMINVVGKPTAAIRAMPRNRIDTATLQLPIAGSGSGNPHSRSPSLNAPVNTSPGHAPNQEFRSSGFPHNGAVVNGVDILASAGDQAAISIRPMRNHHTCDAIIMLTVHNAIFGGLVIYWYSASGLDPVTDPTPRSAWF